METVRRKIEQDFAGYVAKRAEPENRRWLQKMKEKPPYHKWVGVVLGFLLNGSAHFLSGKRATGLKWYLGLFACGLAALALVATPGTLSFVLGAAFAIANVLLWLIMLKQSYRPVQRIGFLGWLSVIILAVVLNNGLSFLVLQFVHPFKVPSGAMQPTIIPKDLIFVERLTYRFGKPKRGDIIVFRTKGIEGIKSDTFFIKRLAGLPGESVRIEPPFLIVNDQKVVDPIVFNTISRELDGYAGFQTAGHTAPDEEITLGPNEYFVLGDNTRSSLDSRYWGAVPEENIIGRATRIYWPFNRVNKSLGKE